MRANGMTFAAIADQLNHERVQTLGGAGEWGPASIKAAAGFKRPGGYAGYTPRSSHS